MKPQLFATFGRAVCALIFFSAIFALPALAAPAPCTSLNLPTGPTAYVAASPNLVSVVDASAHAEACTVTVGGNPGNLAASPDSNFLFVENDTDGTVSVVNLATGIAAAPLTITGSSMTANLAVSPDNSKVYVVTLPATLTPSTQASLYVISLPSMTVSGPIPVVAPAPASPTPVTAAGLGIAFTPDASKAYIATEGLTYVVNTATNSVSSTVAVSGGSVAIDQNGVYAYVLDVAVTASTAVSQIAITNNAVTTLNNISPLCTQGNTLVVAPPPNSNLVFYSCPGNGTSSFISVVNFSSGTPETAVQSVTVSDSQPQGLFISSDGNSAYVAVNNGTVALVDLTTSPYTLIGISTTNLAEETARGIVQRPVQVSTPVSPTTASVPTGLTQQFTGAVSYAFSMGQTLTWAVNGTTGGNLATSGSISGAGLYTAPQALSALPNPVTRQVSVTAASSELPANFAAYPALYPLTATVTVTPSQLVFTTQPPSTGTQAGSTLATVAVSVEDASGNVDTTSAVSITVTPSSVPASVPPGANLPAAVTVMATNGVATFTNDLTFTKVGTTPSGLVPYTYSLTASVTSTPAPTLTSATSNSFTIVPGNPTQLVIAGVGTQIAGTNQPLTITAEDSSGNTATPYSGTKTLTFSGANPSPNPTTAPTVTDMNGMAQNFGVPTMLTFTNGVSTAGGSMTLYKAETATISVLDAATMISAAGSNQLTVAVSPASANKLAFTTPLGAPNGIAGTAGSPLNSPPVVAVEDAYGNLEPTSSAQITMVLNSTLNSAPASVSFSAGSQVTATGGIASFSSLTIQQANVAPPSGSMTVNAYSYQITATSPNLTSAGPTPTTPFGINPAAAKNLVFTTEPASGGTAGIPLPLAFAPIVVVEDQFNNVVTSPLPGSNASITITSAASSMAPVTPPAASVTGMTTVPASNGVAQFTDLILTSANIAPVSGSTIVSPYNYTLMAMSSGLSNGVSMPTFTINPASPVSLVFTTQPAPQSLGGNVTPLNTNPPQGPSPGVIVCLEDTYGNVANSNTSVTIVPSPTGSFLTAMSAPTVPAVAGVAEFSNLRFAIAGTYTLSAASAAPALTKTSTSFNLSTQITFSAVTLTNSSTSVLLQGEKGSVANPLPIGLSDTQTITVNGDPNTNGPASNGSLGVTWSVSCPAASCGTIVPNTGVYTAPSSLPSTVSPTTGLPVTVTATAVADPSKNSGNGFTITVYPVLYSPFTPNPPTVTVATGATNGVYTINLQGPVAGSGPSFQFTCSNFTGLANATCTFTNASGSVIPGGLVTPGTSPSTSVTLTVGITRASTSSLNPGPESSHRPQGPRRPWLTLGLLLSVVLIGLALFRLPGQSVPKTRQAFALVLLLVIALGWMSACSQFSVPPTPSSPGGTTVTSSGTFTLTITPVGTNAANFTAITIPNIVVTVN